MATIIHFARGDEIKVREDEDDVQSALHSEKGLPVALTDDSTGARIFVNPTQITYWTGNSP